MFYIVLGEDTLPKGHIKGKQDDLEENLPKNDWQPIHEDIPYLVYSESRDVYHCEEHGTDFSDKPRVTLHLHKFHNVNPDGTVYKQEKNKAKDPDEGEEEDDNPTPSEKKLLEEWGEMPKDDENKEAGEDAFEIHKRKRAEAIARVMENPYVSMFFVESRQLKLFPPTFDEGDIIREALEYLGKHMGFSINVGYNPKIVTDPELRSKLQYAARAWDNYEEGEEDGT